MLRAFVCSVELSACELPPGEVVCAAVVGRLLPDFLRPLGSLILLWAISLTAC